MRSYLAVCKDYIESEELNMEKELLLDVAEKMEALAGSIRKFCEMNGAEASDVVQTVVSDKTPALVSELKVFKLEDVRKALAEKSAAGFTAEVRELLKRHGAAKLSAIAESEYAAIMEEVKELGGKV